MSGPRLRLAVLLLAGAALYGFRLGFPDFWGRHWESRRALVARTMVETGDWLVPSQNGAVTLTKPPLYYWMTAGAMALTGNRAELGARLPSAVAGAVGLWIVWRTAALLGGTAAGGLAALFLLGNVLWFGHARTAEMDLVLAVFEAGAVLAFLTGRAGVHPRRWAALGWALVAAGFLVKGPVGVLLPLAVVAVFRIADRRDRFGRSGGWVCPGMGLVIFALLVAPWFLAVLARVPDAGAVFLRETLTRYQGELDHPEPVWFYLPVLAVGLLPGMLFLPLWIREARRPSHTGSLLRRLAWVLLLPLLFLSLSGSKRVYYVLPLWPVAAVGFGLAVARARETEAGRWLCLPTALLGLALAAGAAGAVLVPRFGGPPFFSATPLPLVLLGLTGVLGAAGVALALRGRWLPGLAGGVLGILAACVFLVEGVGPVSNAYRSRKAFAQEAAARTPAGTPLCMLHRDNYALPFYAGRPIRDLRPDDLCPLLCRERTIHLILDSGQAARLAALPLRAQTVFEATYVPPGRPGSLRSLRLVRVRSAGCPCP